MKTNFTVRTFILFLLLVFSACKENDPLTIILRLEGNLNFGEVKIGSTDTRILTIYNDGNSDLNIININCPEGFSSDWTEGIITSSDSQKVNIIYSPEENKTYSGTIEIESNSIVGESTINVSGGLILPGHFGFFIINEGLFGSANTSLSYFNKTENTIINHVFRNNNNDVPLGDQTQSMGIVEEKGFILVQNSNKVEVIDVRNFSSITTIQFADLNPRYFTAVSDKKAYISDWSLEGVRILDIENNQFTATISTGKDPEKMAFANGKLYVPNSGSQIFPGLPDSTLSIIDVTTDKVIAHIELTYQPSYVQADKDGNVWVLCKGLNVYNPDFSLNEEKSTPGVLFKLDAQGNQLLKLDFPSRAVKPDRLVINFDKDVLYYLYQNAVYNMSISDNALPTNIFIEKKFYGIAVDPSNNNIIGTEVPDFTSAGEIYRYDTQGNFIDQYTVGIGPNGCAFPF